MKRTFRIIAAALVAIVLIGMIWLGNGFFGNPVSALLARRGLNRYVQQTYSYLDLTTDRFGFDFKTGGYFARLASQSSPDTAFYIRTDMLGRVTYDSFDTWVSEKRNTEQRVQEQYRLLVDAVLEDPSFPYTSDILGGMLDFQQDREVGDNRDFSYAIPREELVLDKVYSQQEILAFGERAGILTIYVQEDTVTAQRAAQIMLHIRELFDAAGVTFYRMDFVLQHPISADGSFRQEEEIRAELLRSEIREEGLVSRIQSSHKEISERFAQMDAQKGIISPSND